MIDVVILFFIGLIASSISGAAGFGGAMILIPILTNIVGLQSAIPILTISQVFGNASRIWFSRTELNWKPIIYFLIPAIPLTILGSNLFAIINPKFIKVFVGIFLIALVIYRRLQKNKLKIGSKGILIGGGITGFISGIAGSAGPLGAAFFLGLNLSAGAYIASEAFTALSMHLVKSVVYSRYSLMGEKEILYGILIGVSMIIGSWIGKKIIERISKAKFILLVEALLLISGIQIIISVFY